MKGVSYHQEKAASLYSIEIGIQTGIQIAFFFVNSNGNNLQVISMIVLIPRYLLMFSQNRSPVIISRIDFDTDFDLDMKEQAFRGAHA
ncbi:MAG: hypothetical protein HGA97_07475 [Chlorobiaceae bacterium]|nr:hypothetical protein [Chlorobiaceae bacterium]